MSPFGVIILNRVNRNLIWAVLVGCVVLHPAVAGVYAYTDDNGTVSLSNLPLDNRYQVLVEDQKVEVVAAKNAIEEQASMEAVNVAQKPLSITENKLKYHKIVDTAARTYGLDGALLHAVISVESRYNSKAVSKKGAKGMMQLMPETALRYGVKDSFDPAQNINGGAQYLRDLLKTYNKDVRLALAAYNAGENAVAKYGYRIPPIRETREYVPKVLDYYRKYRVDL